MLNLTASRIVRSDEMPFDASAPVTVVGQALVVGPTAGRVRPGTGNSGEIFVGVALAQPLTLLNFPRVESLVANGSAQITLSRAPISGTLRVVAAESGTALTAGNPSNATEYSISGLVITMNVAARAGRTQNVFYQFVPDANDARSLQGDVQPGGAASMTIGTVGVARAGTVFTSEWDTTADWATANPVIRVGANARFTIGGSGAIVPSASIISPPSTQDSFLGLYFSA